MKLILKTIALTLCLVLLFGMLTANASGVKIKIGGGSKTEQPAEDTAKEPTEEGTEDAAAGSEAPAEEAEAEDEEETPSEPSEAPASEEEFKLSADFKTLKGENVRYYADGKYSFAFLDAGTLVKYVRHTDDTVEVETFINGKYCRVWLSTSAVVLAVTIIQKDGEKLLISELDPEYSTKIKEGKILATAGKDNPLINVKKQKDVNTLLTDSLSYDHTGLKLEPNATAGGGNKKKNGKGGNSTVVDKTLTADKKVTIGLKTGGSSSGVGLSKTTTVSNPISATVQKESSAKIYEKRSADSNVESTLKEGDSVEVHNLGAAFSYVVSGSTKGYIQTSALKFEDGSEFVILSEKTGKIVLREQKGTKGKKVTDLKNGIVALVVEEGDKFTKIKTNGVEGYVAKSSTHFISLADSVNTNATVNKDKVNSRTGNFKDNPLVEALKKGTNVVVVEEKGDWSQIELPNGKSAFIESKFLDIQ